jgi:hypothetical protein
MKSGPLTLAAGCGLLLPAWTGLFLSGVPTTLCPLPVLTITPAFILDSGPQAFRFISVVVLIPALLFFAWNPGLFHGGQRIPKRSFVLMAVLTALTVIWFIAGWKYGVEYQGRPYTYAICVVNIGWLMLLWVMFIRYRRGASFTGNLLFHWIMFAWLAWYAFPYLGELP